MSDFGLSDRVTFKHVKWDQVPEKPGVYVIYDKNDEVIYVGMAGRNGKGNLRNRLRDHRSGQIVNMFAQYLFLARVQFEVPDRIKNPIVHPRDAKSACHKYIVDRCSFWYEVTKNGATARIRERDLKVELKPKLNP